MKHFDVTEWADFARGMLPAAQRAAMDEHLSLGCAKCRGMMGMFEKLIPAARADASLEVPEYAVHCAKALAALIRPERVEVKPRLAARLLFDSFLEPMPVGVRSQHRLTRQTLYETGEYAIDLRQEYERGSGRVTLVGQIGNRIAPECPVGAVPVYLRCGRNLVAQATSNQFGEFEMEYSPRRNLRLEIPVNPENRRRAASRGRGARRVRGHEGGLK